jgi:hypothetical protein
VSPGSPAIPTHPCPELPSLPQPDSTPAQPFLLGIFSGLKLSPLTVSTTNENSTNAHLRSGSHAYYQYPEPSLTKERAETQHLSTSFSTHQLSKIETCPQGVKPIGQNRTGDSEGLVGGLHSFVGKGCFDALGGGQEQDLNPRLPDPSAS